MKSPSVVSIVLFTIFAISVLEVSCNVNGTCKQYNELCIDDTDCCTGNCRRSFTLKKYCKTSLIDMINQFISPKIDNAMCSYINVTNSSSPLFPDKSHKVLTAAHQTLPLNSMVEVKHNNKTVLVQVKERLSTESMGPILYLSQDAAKEIGLVINEFSPCELYVPAMKNCIVLRNLVYVIPSVSVLLGLVVYREYFLSLF